MKKPTSLLETQLDDSQQAQLVDWLLSGMKYHEARVMVEKEFGIVLKSLSPFSRFWSSVCVPHLIRRRHTAVETAQEVASAAASSPGRFDAATIDSLKQKAFELSISPNANPKDVKSILMLVLKARDQELDREQLDLDKDKFEFNAAAQCLKHLPSLREIAANTNLDQNAKLQQIRLKLFGQLPE